MADIFVATTGNDSTGTGSSGNPYASPGKAASVMSGGDRVCVKSGTYLITTSSSNVAGGVVNDATGTSTASQWVGYAVTPGDNGTPPILRASGISSCNLFRTAGTFNTVENITVDGASLTSIRGFELASTIVTTWLLKAMGCTNIGINLNSGSNSSTVYFSEATGCSSQPAIQLNQPSILWGCYSHDNTVTGISMSGVDAYIVDCISANNTGATSDGIFMFARGGVVRCTTAFNGRHGVNWNTTQKLDCVGSLSYGNSGFGFTADANINMSRLVNSAGGNNTSGNVGSNITNTPGFVTLSGNPFTASGSGDFSLNNTAGAGAACRAAGIPGVFPGGTTTGYLDAGAVQHQDAGGSTVVVVNQTINRFIQAESP